jgi:hypothetical protein
MKFRVFWDVARSVTLKLTDVSEMCTASIRVAMIMKAVRTFETSVSFNVTTQRYIPEDSKHHIRRRENLKYHVTHIKISREKSYYLEDQMSGLLMGEDPGNYI